MKKGWTTDSAIQLYEDVIDNSTNNDNRAYAKDVLNKLYDERRKSAEQSEIDNAKRRLSARKSRGKRK